MNTNTNTKHVLQQITKRDHQPGELVRCPSCMQLAIAGFSHEQTGKKFCVKCSRKFEANGTAILKSSKGYPSFSFLNQDGEICLISRDQKRILYLSQSKEFKFRTNMAEAIAQALDKPTDWVQEQIKFLLDEGFKIPNRNQRHDAFYKYVYANILRFNAKKISDYSKYMSLADAIADETGHSTKLVRRIVRNYLSELKIEKVSKKPSIAAKLIDFLKSNSGCKFTLIQIESHIGGEVPRGYIRHTCDRLARKGLLRKARERKCVYFSLP